MVVTTTGTQIAAKLHTSGLPNVWIDVVGEELEILVNIKCKRSLETKESVFERRELL